MKCGICKRALDVPGDILSTDCGGDCWGCVGALEAEMGSGPSLEKVVWELAFGIRGRDFITDDLLAQIDLWEHGHEYA